MNKESFLDEIRRRLSGLPEKDIEEQIAFYSEMIDDRMEDGVSEEDAVSEIGSLDRIVNQTMSERTPADPVKEKVMPVKAARTKRRTRKWVTAGVVLLCAAILICGISFVFSRFGLLGSGSKYRTNTYEVERDFRSISIKADTEDILFVPSEDGICKVVCREEEDALHQVSVQGDQLTIEHKKEKRWYFHFGFSFESPEISVYLPGEMYDKLSVEADTGDIEIPEAFTFSDIRIKLDSGDVRCLVKQAGNIDIRTDTGEITLAHVSAEGLVLSSDTGNLNLTNVIAEEAFRLETDTGEVTFNGCDAGAIYVKTDSGSVTGTLLSEKVFLTETDTGSIDVPKTITGGRCEITTDTGDIRIRVE